MSSQGMSPIMALVIVVVVVLLLSISSRTKRWAYWIGGVVLFLLLYPRWKASGFKLPGGQ